MFTLSILGPVDLRDARGQEISAILSAPKRLALIVCLALRGAGRFCYREYLLSLLWPDHNSASAHHALRNTLYESRTALGSGMILNRGAGEVAMSGDRFSCDLWAFDDAIRRGRVERAIDLYRGDLLEGFHLCCALDFEQYIEEERQKRARGYERSLKALAEVSQAAGDLGKAIELWSGLVARDPYNSKIILHLMSALVASGDRAGALRRAQVHRAMLCEGLGLDQDPEVDAFARRIRGSSTKAVGILPGPQSAQPRARGMEMSSAGEATTAS